LGHPDALTLVDQRRGFHMDCSPRTQRALLRRWTLPLHHISAVVWRAFSFPPWMFGHQPLRLSHMH